MGVKSLLRPHQRSHPSGNFSVIYDMAGEIAIAAILFAKLPGGILRAGGGIGPLKVCAFLAAVGVVACQHTATTEPAARVHFVIVPQACSSVLPVEFSIDGRLVGTDTFRVDVAGPRMTSRDFEASPGSHVVGARVTGGFVWPNQTLSMAAGAVVSDSLPFSCS